MTEAIVFLGTLTLLLLFGTQHDDVHRDIECPSCEQLESRNAGNNVNDDCHDYFEYVCENMTFLETDVGKHFESIMSKPSDAIPVRFVKTTKEVKTEIRNITSLSGKPETKLECITDFKVPFSPRLSFRWRKDGIKLRKYNHLQNRYSYGLNGSLTILDMSQLDSDKAKITDAPDQYLKLGKQGVINCYFTANPPFDYVIWLKNARVIFEESLPGFSILPNGSLLIANVSKKDEGYYQCKPHNVHGTMGSSKMMQITY
ncbi:Protein turtle-like protein [Leptotrombidium deliense]|uniref:Protein turtle-like protein n=1 Tax=Leptotrombidium deliense TaxID=299467 RepID=A0A443S8I9_9ACAR|nr:Protein turtle-like protein [Leptotrombidium deliense]